MCFRLVQMGEVIQLPRQSRFRVEDFDTLETGEMFWRVKGLWPSVGVCFLAGPSMAGKSFRALNWLAKVCRGEPVLGRRSVPCGILYVASEGAQGVRKRIMGLRSEIGALDGAFKFIGQAPNLTDADDLADLRITLEGARAELDAAGFPLGIVAIDTLSASVPGADENSAKDMSPVLTALQNLAEEMGIMVLMIAHTGKVEERGIRGWSGLLANADGLIMLEDPKGSETRTGTVVKVKDGPAGDTFAFVLREVALGHDSDGDEITTCVVDEADAPSKTSARAKALHPDQELLMRALRLCVDDERTIAVSGPGVAPGTVGVRRSDLKAKMFDIGFSDQDENPDSVKRSINRHIKALASREVLRATEYAVWPV